MCPGSSGCGWHTAQFAEITGTDHDRGDVRLTPGHDFDSDEFVTVFEVVDAGPSLPGMPEGRGMPIDGGMSNNKVREVCIAFNDSFHTGSLHKSISLLMSAWLTPLL
ncbi:hypothetical protein EDWATA_01942 [Edwardsiella tarda ATCC 23685]|uniref:Uncharacterized protein n=1 Tax=Edwardsiella tarda ATCC 23685 TaxID=500638 RepID=D4F5B4_EDWTA|nr:hypothetical protein EDWATA_01942 [Edwardsiella tarda ATCC 23685]